MMIMMSLNSSLAFRRRSRKLRRCLNEEVAKSLLIEVSSLIHIELTLATRFILRDGVAWTSGLRRVPSILLVRRLWKIRP